MLQNPPSPFSQLASRFRGGVPFEAWYIAGHPTRNDIPAAAAFGVDVLAAIPFIEVEGGILDRIGFQVTVVGALGSVARCGIYMATSRRNPYPGTRIVDSGEFDTTVVGGIGVKAATVSVQMQRGTLYWFVYHCGVAAPTIAAVQPNGLRAPCSIFGSAAGTLTDTRNFLNVATAYAALPATFPAGATPTTGGTVQPAVAARYSS